MASLSGFTPASTFQSLIKTVNNLAVTGAVQLSDGNGNLLPITVSSASVLISAPLTASIVSATDNGNGTNFKVGDDVWIGDVNLANTAQITGQQDPTQGFLKFSNSSKNLTVGANSNQLFTGLNMTGSVSVSATGSTWHFAKDIYNSTYLILPNSSSIANDIYLLDTGGVALVDSTRGQLMYVDSSQAKITVNFPSASYPEWIFTKAGALSLPKQGIIYNQQNSAKQLVFDTGSNLRVPVNLYVSSSVITNSIYGSGRFVNVSGSLLISGSLTVNSGSIGISENTLVLGPAPAGGVGEGGQLLLSAKGGGYDSASMWDNYQNKTRLLRGSNAGSDGTITSFDMSTGQLTLLYYTGSGTFAGTAVASLGVDSGGNVITTNSITSYTPTGYLSAYHTASLFGNVENTPLTMSFSTTDFSFGGVTISGSYSDKIKINTTGIYNIQFSAQTTKTSGTSTTFYIWLAKNGVEVPSSNTGVTLAGGANDVAIPAWNFFTSASAGDYYQLRFAVTHNNGVIAYTPSGSAGLTGPAVPSVILTVNRVG